MAFQLPRLRCAIAILLLSASVAVFAAGPPPEAQAKAYLEELWRSTGTPGISVAVMVQGRLAFADGVGFADLENMVPATGSTVYNIGSVSKALGRPSLSRNSSCRRRATAIDDES